jgi:hypothetical protein
MPGKLRLACHARSEVATFLRLPAALDLAAELTVKARRRRNRIFFEAHVNLANALAKTPGRIPDAIAEYEAALRLNADPWCAKWQRA